MRRLILVLFSIVWAFNSSANMASPIINGTLGSRPFINQFVDVIHEELFIRLDKAFETAQFDVKYHIKSSKDGVSIPFLFYASEYLDDFTVKIDGKVVDILPIPDSFEVPQNSKFNDFSYFFEAPNYSGRSTVVLSDSGSGGRVLEMRNMLYFETDITEGEHIIEASYKASHWTNKSDWMKEYSFRYALSPAKYWKSFGSLTVTLDATLFDQSITSNLGKPQAGNINSIATWKFDKLPTEIAQWNFQSPKSTTVKTLIAISPLGLASIVGVLLAILHFIWVRWYRKKYSGKKFSLAVIVGSIFVPLIFLLCWINGFAFIDALIGENAGRYHGYVFLYILLYPFILLVYWVIFWLMDRDLKNGLLERNKP